MVRLSPAGPTQSSPILLDLPAMAAWTRTQIDTIGPDRRGTGRLGHCKVEYDVSRTLASSYVAIKETLGGQSCNRAGS